MGKKIETTKKVLEKSSEVAQIVGKAAAAIVTVSTTVVGIMGNNKK